MLKEICHGIHLRGRPLAITLKTHRHWSSRYQSHPSALRLALQNHATRTWNSILNLMLLSHPWFTGRVKNDVRVYSREGTSESLVAPLVACVIGFKSWDTDILMVRSQGYLLPRKLFMHKIIFLMLFSGSVYRNLIHLLSPASFLPCSMMLLHKVVDDFGLSYILKIYLPFTMDRRSDDHQCINILIPLYVQVHFYSESARTVI